MQPLQKIYEHKDFLVQEKGYNQDNLLGVFCYGSQNYNLDTKNSDVDAYAIYIPTLEEMCLKKEWLSVEHKTKEGEHIIVKDIREFALMLKKQSVNFIETLFTEFKWVNKKYQNLWKQCFEDFKEEIATYDKKATILAASHQARNTLRQGEENHDMKKLANAHRLKIFLINYLNGIPYENCLKLDAVESEYLKNMKIGGVHISYPHERELLENHFNKFIESAEEAPKKNKATEKIIDMGVVTIINASLKNEEAKIDLETFFNKLTHAEERALAAVTATVQDEGTVNVSSLVEQHHISRPVFTNLFIKLKENNIAEIVNQGVKGTHIKFLHSGLRYKIKELGGLY